MSEEFSDAAAAPTQDEKTMALIAHLGGIITGPLAALIIWLIKKDDSEFVGDQAKEALNFQITVFLASIVSSILVIVVIGIFLLLAVAIADIVLCIVAGLKAMEGQRYRYPWALRLVN